MKYATDEADAADLMPALDIKGIYDEAIASQSGGGDGTVYAGGSRTFDEATGQHAWRDPHGELHPTISTEVGEFLDANYAWDSLTADDWIWWNDHKRQWVLNGTNEAGINAYLAIHGKAPVPEAGKISIWDAVPPASSDEWYDKFSRGSVKTAESAGEAVGSLLDQTKAFALVIGMALILWYMGRK